MARESGTKFGPGDWAIVDDEDESRAIVVDTPDVPAGEYTVPGTDKTVAAYNDCDPDELVVSVVYVESLNDSWPTWSASKVLDRQEAGTLHKTVRSYAFPESRLELLEVYDY